MKTENVGRIEILRLMHMTTISTSNCDESIRQFKTVLVDTNIYNAYKHLNRFYYIENSNWLPLMMERYRREEWVEFKIWLNIVIKLECWKLKLPSFYLNTFNK